MANALLSFFLVMSLSTAIYARSKASAESGVQDPIVTSEQIEKLPLVSDRPQISFQRALRIAQTYCKKNPINLTTFFLLEGRLTHSVKGKDNHEAHWYFKWINVDDSIPDVEITVSMRGTAERLPVN